MRLFTIAIFVCFAVIGKPVLACGPVVHVQFYEASPDRFRITFVRGAKLELTSLKIKLDGSAAGVIFDDHDGLDMQGPQPFKTGVAIKSVRYTHQGETSVSLMFEHFLEGRWFDFISDLDDNGLANDADENHLMDGELKGASATAVLTTAKGRRIEIDGQFDGKSMARLAERACV